MPLLLLLLEAAVRTLDSERVRGRTSIVATRTRPSSEPSPVVVAVPNRRAGELLAESRAGVGPAGVLCRAPMPAAAQSVVTGSGRQEIEEHTHRDRLQVPCDAPRPPAALPLAPLLLPSSFPFLPPPLMLMRCCC